MMILEMCWESLYSFPAALYGDSSSKSSVVRGSRQGDSHGGVYAGDGNVYAVTATKRRVCIHVGFDAAPRRQPGGHAANDGPAAGIVAVDNLPDQRLGLSGQQAPAGRPADGQARPVADIGGQQDQRLRIGVYVEGPLPILIFLPLRLAGGPYCPCERAAVDRAEPAQRHSYIHAKNLPGNIPQSV